MANNYPSQTSAPAIASQSTDGVLTTEPVGKRYDPAKDREQTAGFLARGLFFLFAISLVFCSLHAVANYQAATETGKVLIPLASAPFLIALGFYFAVSR